MRMEVVLIMISNMKLIWILVTVQVEVELEEITVNKFNYKWKMLEGVLLMGLIGTLVEKYLLVVMKELNYKLEVKFMTEVPVNISNMKLI